MPRRFALGNAQDLVQAERDIREPHDREKDQLASLLRMIIRTVEE